MVGETGKGKAANVDRLCLNSCPCSKAERRQEESGTRKAWPTETDK